MAGSSSSLAPQDRVPSRTLDRMQIPMQMGPQGQQTFYQGGMPQSPYNTNPNMMQPNIGFGQMPNQQSYVQAPQMMGAQPIQIQNVQAVPQMVVAQPVQVANYPAGNQVVMARPTTHGGRMKCPHCQTDIVTEITHSYGTLTWVIVIGLGITGIWPCCLIPFCCKQCMDVKHQCSSCMRTTHVYKRM
ncbi:hypothetical protein UPYG_G00059590 [Umbra pygmaea]|uniref:LITAF domain-containing protein n=1 Tax=Umbra pygmaea TaxID=75934 RepID=A0ABD0XYI2_UMBPY